MSTKFRERIPTQTIELCFSKPWRVVGKLKSEKKCYRVPGTNLVGHNPSSYSHDIFSQPYRYSILVGAKMDDLCNTPRFVHMLFGRTYSAHQATRLAGASRNRTQYPRHLQAGMNRWKKIGGHFQEVAACRQPLVRTGSHFPQMQDKFAGQATNKFSITDAIVAFLSTSCCNKLVEQYSVQFVVYKGHQT